MLWLKAFPCMQAYCQKPTSTSSAFAGNNLKNGKTKKNINYWIFSSEYLFKENREQRLRWVLWCTWYTLFYKCKHLTRLYTSPSPLRGLLSFENAIWKPIPTFPIGKELKQQISSLKRKQMVSPFSLEGDGGGYLFSKKMIGFSLMSLWCRLLKTCFHNAYI